MQEKMIEPWQLRKAYAIASQLGLVEKSEEVDELHYLLNERFGKQSMKELTKREAGELLHILLSLQTTPSPKGVYSSRANMASVGQQKKIWSLMYELRNLDSEPNHAPVGERLAGIVKRELKLSATTSQPLAWVGVEEADKLIEKMKFYIRSAKRKSKEGCV